MIHQQFQQLVRRYSEFRLYLADLDLTKKKICKMGHKNYNLPSVQITPESYQWIERIIQTPIPDHRKHTLELVPAPYLVVIKHLSFSKAYVLIKDLVNEV